MRQMRWPSIAMMGRTRLQTPLMVLYFLNKLKIEISHVMQELRSHTYSYEVASVLLKKAISALNMLHEQNCAHVIFSTVGGISRERSCTMIVRQKTFVNRYS